MRTISVCAFCFLLFTSILSADDEAGEAANREKRVSSTALDGQPSPNVNFDEEQKGSRPKSFRRLSSGGINGEDFAFPIMMPPYNLGSVKPGSRKPEWGSCLLYVESISVIVFFKDVGKDMTSGVAYVDGGSNNKNRFKFGDGAISCLQMENGKAGDKTPKEFWFRIQVDVQEEGKAMKLNDANKILFSVTGIDVTIKFQQKSDYSWSLKDVFADNLSLKKGTLLEKDISIDQKSSVNGNRSMKISGFTDYNYACSSTPAAVWTTDDQKYSIGVSFNNIQLQPFGIGGKDGPKEGPKGVRFGNRVNDCVGLFSVGSWMGIIVAIILLAVLSFGYLMLNSVQTMDRFDDPKQKQLIINAKE